MADQEIRFTAVGMTDVGLVREHNEDNFLAVDMAEGTVGSNGQLLQGTLQKRGLALVVCDGMGGAAAGEVASEMAVTHLNEEFANADLGGTVQSEPDVIGLLETAIHKANEAIYTQAQENKDQQGMGTTLTGAVILNDSLYLSQVGDSRGYVLRKGKLVQMTRDQSLIGQLIEEGTLTEEQAEKLGGKNIILQALGVEETLKIDSKRYDILQDDVIMLCSDGLTGFATDEEIEGILNETPDLQEAAKKLIEAACNGGGKDNITVILGRFEGDGLREPLAAASADDLAGAAYKAPPPPKSKAGRNAVIATVAILAVVAIFLFRSKPLHVVIKSSVDGSSVTITGADEGGPPDAGEVAKGTCGSEAFEFDLEKGFRYVVTVGADGYVDQTRFLDADVEHNEQAMKFNLELIPAETVRFNAPMFNGKRLRGLKAVLKKEGRDDQILDDPNDDDPPIKDFPAGEWTASISRPGFEPVEFEFSIETKVPQTVDFPPMKEITEGLTVTGAWEGAAIQVMDGEEALLASAAKVSGSDPVSLQVRAAKVRVVVTRDRMREFEKVVDLASGPITVSLEDFEAQVSFKGPPQTRIQLLREGGGAAIVGSVDMNGASETFGVKAGRYVGEVIQRDRSRIKKVLVLHPGEVAVNLDIIKF